MNDWRDNHSFLKAYLEARTKLTEAALSFDAMNSDMESLAICADEIALSEANKIIRQAKSKAKNIIENAKRKGETIESQAIEKVQEATEFVFESRKIPYLWLSLWDTANRVVGNDIKYREVAIDALGKAIDDIKDGLEIAKTAERLLHKLMPTKLPPHEKLSLTLEQQAQISAALDDADARFDEGKTKCLAS